MIREWNVIQKLQIVFVIERAPAAIFVLHADQPGKPALHRTAQTLGIGIGDATQRHQHEGGIVNVRIKLVLEFKRPATGRSLWIFDLPVSRTENLIPDHPALGGDE